MVGWNYLRQFEFVNPTNTSKLLGSATKWLNFPIRLQGDNPTGSRNQILTCLNNNSSDLTEACDSLNGEIVGLDQCTRIFNPTAGDSLYPDDDYSQKHSRCCDQRTWRYGGHRKTWCMRRSRFIRSVKR